MLRLLLSIAALGSILALPRQDTQNHEGSQNLKPLLFLVERSNPQQQKEERLAKQQFGFSSPLAFGGFPYFEPQFRYQGFNQQSFPGPQPSIVLYGAAGQGQPILINPGIPPGHNFLVPQQPRPGPDIMQRPHQRPFFVGGFPNPKPAHIPPIEKDAEEIPTNPAMIPPLPSTTTTMDRKPEKLETFTEGTNERPFKTTNEASFPSAAAGGTPQLRPGHRFFILNGDNLFQDYPFTYPEDLKYTRQQSAPQYPTQGPEGFNSLPVQTFPHDQSFSPNLYPAQSSQQFDPTTVALSQHHGQPEVALFRSTLGGEPVGHFRFTPPSEPYYPFDGEDVENDAVVVNAKYEDDIGQDQAAPEDQSSAVANAELDDKYMDPSTAQAAPGAIALAGQGGVAGASPKATSLAGKGGLAISSPQATAVAGADDEKVDVKGNKPSKKSRNK